MYKKYAIYFRNRKYFRFWKLHRKILFLRIDQLPLANCKNPILLDGSNGSNETLNIVFQRP